MPTKSMSSTQCLTMISCKFSYLFGRVLSPLHNVVDFLKKICFLITDVMFLVKIKLVMPATNASSEYAFKSTQKGEVLSPYNHVEQPPQLFSDMHSSKGAGEGAKP